jgi:hypothetical protein
MDNNLAPSQIFYVPLSTSTNLILANISGFYCLNNDIERINNDIHGRYCDYQKTLEKKMNVSS